MHVRSQLPLNIKDVSSHMLEAELDVYRTYPINYAATSMTCYLLDVSNLLLPALTYQHAKVELAVKRWARELRKKGLL
jgi:hypothetical protein